MTALKPTSPMTALARILALPVMAGALVACDYASRLPDAPSQLPYELADKPPSVTGQEAKRLPPPPDSFAKLDAPVEYRTGAEAAEEGTAESAAASALPLPAPQGGADEDVAFEPLEFEVAAGETATVGSAEFAAPPMTLSEALPVPQAAVPVANPLSAPAAAVPVGVIETAPVQQAEFGIAPFESVPVIDDAILAQTMIEDAAPVEPVEIQTAQTVEPYVVPAPTAGLVTILHSRLNNGAVVSVHPVVGAPGQASSALTRTIATEIGIPIAERDARYAYATFDLRGRAQRDTAGFANVEWTLHDRNGTIIGVFSERHDGNGWDGIGDTVLESMGRQVAGQIEQNAELRRATLHAAADAPSITTMEPIRSETEIGETPKYARSALAMAPMPRPSPRPKVYAAAPEPQPVVRQPVVPQAPTQLVAPTAVAAAPAPTVRTEPPTPLVSAPPPSFDTLRPVETASASVSPAPVAAGPRPLVFRGVQGAPGDGDQSLSREVSRLLAESGATVAANGGPESLYLTATVSKTPTANADRIEIIWSVQDATGTSIGQVTQANDVPRGALDSSWGEDAYYAAEGARDGIIQLLQTSGALDS